MTHPTERLPDYLMGELHPEEVTELETHLEGCEACREELARLAAPVGAMTEAFPQERPPERVWQGLQARFLREVASQGEVQEAEHEPGTEEMQVLTEPARAPYPYPSYGWLLAACLALVMTGGSLFWGYRNFQAYQQVRTDVRLLTDFLARPQVQRVVLENVVGSDRSESPGSLLLTPEGDALFVLSEAAPPGRAYQAWGHISSDWDLERGEELTSLRLSEGSVFEVPSSGFASLYLSLEPARGSPQPTEPLSKVSLLTPRSDTTVRITNPEADTALSSNSVIVSGTVNESVTGLRYTVDGGEATEVTFANNRFSFTVTGLAAGESTVRVTATAAGETFSDSVRVSFEPPDTQ